MDWWYLSPSSSAVCLCILFRCAVVVAYFLPCPLTNTRHICILPFLFLLLLVSSLLSTIELFMFIIITPSQHRITLFCWHTYKHTTHTYIRTFTTCIESNNLWKTCWRASMRTCIWVTLGGGIASWRRQSGPSRLERYRTQILSSIDISCAAARTILRHRRRRVFLLVEPRQWSEASRGLVAGFMYIMMVE